VLTVAPVAMSIIWTFKLIWLASQSCVPSGLTAKLSQAYSGDGKELVTVFVAVEMTARVFGTLALPNNANRVCPSGEIARRLTPADSAMELVTVFDAVSMTEMSSEAKFDT
jgi:hypothetical protein